MLDPGQQKSKMDCSKQGDEQADMEEVRKQHTTRCIYQARLFGRSHIEAGATRTSHLGGR